MKPSFKAPLPVALLGIITFLLQPAPLSAYPGRPVASTLVSPVIVHPDDTDADFDGILDTYETVIADTIAAGGGGAPAFLMVTLHVPPNSGHVALAGSLGGIVTAQFEAATYGLAVTIPFVRVADLAAGLGADLCLIEHDAVGRADMDVATQNIRVDPRVWDTYKLEGDTVSSIAILDSGIAIEHDDLGDELWQDASGGWPSNAYKVVGWKDVVAGTANPTDAGKEPSPGFPHGSFCSGVASGWGAIDPDYTGVAPDAHLVGVRISYNDARGSDWLATDLCKGIDWIIKNKNTYQIDAANISASWCGNYSVSWTGVNPSTILGWVETLVRNGVVVTVSAGNSYDQESTDYCSGSVGYKIAYPALSPYATTVGATGDNNQMSGFSSNGGAGSKKPDVVAPGGTKISGNLHQSIHSVDTKTNGNEDGYHDGWGTSFSSPQATGVAALLVQQLKKSNAWTRCYNDAVFVKSLMLMSATETNTAGDDPDGNGAIPANTPPLNRGARDLVEGYGKINADAAVEAIRCSITPGCSYTAGTDMWPGAAMRQAWGRHFTMSNGDTVCLGLHSPAGGDYDLYVYQECPDSTGDPVLAAQSTNAAGLDSLVIGYSNPVGCLPPCGGGGVVRFAATYFVMVKRVSGMGQFTLNTSTNRGGLIVCGMTMGHEAGHGYGWTYGSQGAGTMEIESGGASGSGLALSVESNGTAPANRASVESPETEIDFESPYSLGGWFQYTSFQDIDLLAYGHVRLRLLSPTAPIQYDPTGTGGLVPLGPPLSSLLPPGVWGEVRVEVHSGGVYQVFINGAPVGTATPAPGIPLLTSLTFGSRVETGSTITARYDELWVDGFEPPTTGVPVGHGFREPLVVIASPNPARRSAAVTFALAERAEASVRVFDLAGRLVRRLAEAEFPSGPVRLTWDGRDDAGREAAPGLYVIRVAAGKRNAGAKVLLMR